MNQHHTRPDRGPQGSPGWSGSPALRTRHATLTADTSAPRLARQMVADVAGSLPADVVERAALAVSELVTNAVLHGSAAGSQIEVNVSADDCAIRAEVDDRGATGPPPERTGGGYGLTIVERTADRWESERGDSWRVVAEFMADPSRCAES